MGRVKEHCFDEKGWKVKEKKTRKRKGHKVNLHFIICLND